MRFAPVLAVAVSLAACTPEGFEITACSLDGRLAFRIHEIDGLLWDSQPRPDWVLVRETALREGGSPHMWNARVYNRKTSEKRPSRDLILYGQRLPAWDLEVAPRQLSAGTEYYVHIADGGRFGETQFIAGERLPNC